MSRRSKVGESHLQLRCQTFGATYGGRKRKQEWTKKIEQVRTMGPVPGGGGGGKSRTRVDFPTLGLGGTLHTSARLRRSTTGGENCPSTRCWIRDWSSESQARL